LVCENCGKRFIPNNSTLKPKFCSRQCKAIFQQGIEPVGLQKNRGKKPRTYHLRHRDKHGNAFDREWREAAFKRDHYICQECGQRGRKLQAHHIKPYKLFPELKYELSNGITLCVECHKKTDTYGWQNYWKSQLAA